MEMMMCLKIGGRICLGHKQNEAEFENYSGFHQWNFDKFGDDFVIWNEHRNINVPALLEGSAAVTCSLKDSFLNVFIQKNAELKLDRLDFNRRMRASLLEVLLATD